MESPTRSPRPLVSPSAVRAWAAARGITVGNRGRLPSEVVDAYIAEKTDRP